MNIIVITPTAPFGKLIQQELEADERYHPTIVSTLEKALKYSFKKEYALAIIDTDTKKQLQKAVKKIRAENPGIKIILIPPENIDKNALSNLNPNGYLEKPFYLPDFTDTLENILSEEEASPTSKGESTTPEEETPLWLRNVNRAAQHLTRLSLETAAQAALIAKDRKMWAYAGQLSQLAANELTQEISNYWNHDEGSDLARFIHLEATDAEYIIYATSLSEHFLLGLAFEAEIPFSKVRAQAGKLAQGLENISTQEEVQPNFVTANEMPAQNVTNSPFANIFEDLELPPSDFAKEAPLFSTQKQQETTPPQRSGTHVQEQEQPTPEKKERAQPSPTPEAASPPQETPRLRPVLNGMHNLTYVCLLIPRFPQHQLEGDIVGYLKKCMQKICVSFGWRLERLNICPEYMEWEVAVSPKTPPYHLIKTLRQHTSQQIFENVPKLEKENPSGKFWAENYVIFSGKTIFSESFIHKFIEDTRQEQGNTSQ